MEVFNDLHRWQRTRAQLPRHASVGFVPTMGNLHAGHASLLKQSKAENDYTIASIFINPTQFNNTQDFTHYPRTLAADLQQLNDLTVDYCLTPHEAAIYEDNYRFQLQETELCERLEGKKRPGHFTGVLTVVMKLFHLIRPTRAYFGEKDYQQLVLIQDMANAFFMDIEVKSCPTIRESSGLALSSRNNRLSPSEYLQAEKFAQIFHQNESCDTICRALQEEGIAVEYVEEFQQRRFAAVKIGDVRLIDNYCIDSSRG